VVAKEARSISRFQNSCEDQQRHLCESS